MPRARPRRAMEQIHGLRPLFQHNARGAFGAAATKIGVHRKPPRVSGNKRRRADRTAMNETRRMPVLPASASAPSPLYVFADSIQYSGTPRGGRVISYELKPCGFWMKGKLARKSRARSPGLPAEGERFRATNYWSWFYR